MIPTDQWENCYDKGWKGILLDASMSHPAKYSRGLITRIIAHALDEGWVQPGSVVLDPFSGVACGALPCMQAGLHYVGIELEPRFVELARENIALWNARYAAHFPGWGSAQILSGDSRRLCEVVSAAGLVVGSPPYSPEALGHKRGEAGAKREATGKYKQGYTAGELTKEYYSDTPGNLGNLPPGIPPNPQPPAPGSSRGSTLNPVVIASPPFAGNTGGRGEASRNGIEPGLFDRHSGGMIGGMGDEPGNLGNLPMGRVGAVIASPPYADGCAHTGGNDPHPEHIEGGKNGVYGVDSYGQTEGQLGAMTPGNPRRGMKAGEVSAVVGSPPFSPGQSTGGEAPKFLDGKPRSNNGIGHNYGSDPDQLGNAAPDTFWAAAKTIIDQCYQILPPNAYAIWVVKNYIKSGAEVDFTGQWQALCEACGFETVHIHRAMLVKKNGSQAGFDGEMVSKDVARKSFFRRLHERRRPDLAIDWESVLCTRKRAG